MKEQTPKYTFEEAHGEATSNSTAEKEVQREKDEKEESLKIIMDKIIELDMKKEKSKEEIEDIFDKEVSPIMSKMTLAKPQNSIIAHAVYDEGCSLEQTSSAFLLDVLDSLTAGPIQYGEAEEQVIKIEELLKDFFGKDFTPDVKIDFNKYHYGELGDGTVYIEGIKFTDLHVNIDDGGVEYDINETMWQACFLKMALKAGLKEIKNPK
jgi:hypothetical protein